MEYINFEENIPPPLDDVSSAGTFIKIKSASGKMPNSLVSMKCAESSNKNMITNYPIQHLKMSCIIWSCFIVQKTGKTPQWIKIK